MSKTIMKNSNTITIPIDEYNDLIEKALSNRKLAKRIKKLIKKMKVLNESES